MNLTWSSELSVGNEIIDRQHQQLFELFAEITNNPDSSLDLILQKIGDYITFHFSEEERWMEQIGYPGISEHRQSHKEFVNSTLRLKMDHFLGGKLSLKQLTKFLQLWLIDHIQTSDLRIKKYCDENVLASSKC